MAKYILSFDIGTSSSKAMLFDLDFNVIGSVQKNMIPSIPIRVGWSSLQNSGGGVARKFSGIATEDPHIVASEIIAVGIDSFSTTVVSVDAQGILFATRSYLDGPACRETG